MSMPTTPEDIEDAWRTEVMLRLTRMEQQLQQIAEAIAKATSWVPGRPP